MIGHGDSRQSPRVGISMKPIVSAIIPVRNGERTLARAIDSALAQRFDGGFEVIVVDDGSRDSTAEIMRGYGDRIITLHRQWSGPAATRNAGVRVSQGKYLAFLDADDEWLPEKFSRSVGVLERHAECAMVYHDAIEVDRAGRVLKTSYYSEGFDSAPTLEDLLSGIWPGMPILVCNVMMRRSVFDRVGGFREDLSACEDVCMWIFAREQGPFRFLAEPLAQREFEFNAYREQSYLGGAWALDRILRERFGRLVAGNIPLPILTWLGTEALLRGQRALALKYYLNALRLRPTRLRTWARLGATMLPVAATDAFRRIAHRRPGDDTESRAASIGKPKSSANPEAP
jgi:glycosyltransferase involved in cell wall biosynthesis